MSRNGLSVAWHLSKSTAVGNFPFHCKHLKWRLSKIHETTSAYGAGALGGLQPPSVGEKIVLFGQNWCTVRAKKKLFYYLISWFICFHPATRLIFYSCHPADVKKGLVKGGALRLFRTNSSKVMFEGNIKNFRTRQTLRGYPNNLVDKIISEVKFEERRNALTHKHRKRTKEFYPLWHNFSHHCHVWKTF